MKTTVLIGCSASKTDGTCRAEDLYTGELYKLVRHWEQLCLAGTSGLILSAKYGLLNPWSEALAYEATLNTVAKRRAFDYFVLSQIWSDRDGVNRPLHLPRLEEPHRVLVFAGENYRGWISEAQKRTSWTFEIPLKGLGIGQQKAAIGRMIDSLKADKHAWPHIPSLADQVNRSLATIGVSS